MSLEEFLENRQGDGGWNSTGEFTVDQAGALAKLKKFSFAREGQWALKVVQHAVSTGARELQVSDEGENIDESIGLSFQYDSREPRPQELESALGALLRRANGPVSFNHLSYALLGALKSSRLFGLIRLRPINAFFAAQTEGRCCHLDLLTGQLNWGDAREQKWTYSISIDRDRPMFSYSFFGHKEIREIDRACAYCPITISINGSPMLQVDDGFLHSPMLLHVDSNRISTEAAIAGNPVWIPRASRSLPLAHQIAIPRCQTSRNHGAAGPGVQGEAGHLEAHFYQPPQGGTQTSIIPVVDGVTMEPVVLESRLSPVGYTTSLPFTAIVACPELRTDQSHGRVVQDERWQAVVESVKEQAEYFSRALSKWRTR